jgi:general secretion pathway protein I
MQRDRANRGFSLLETLVAFSIASLALGVIFQIYAKGTTAVVRAGDYAQAIAIAESMLAAAGLNEAAEIAPSSGTDGKFTWELHRRDYVGEITDDIGSRLHLSEIEADVRWQERGKARSLRLFTLKPVHQ